MNSPSLSSLGPLPPLCIESYDTHPPRNLTKKRIIEELKRETVNLLGIYGKGGVGKATLMKEVWTDVRELKLFSEVVMITVSQNLDLKVIQDKIAEGLGMNITETSLKQRSARIFAKLKQVNKILIILNDLWEEINLVELGIPRGIEHQGCKVIFTTRSVEVCDAMGSNVCIQVKVLSEQDSWELFRQKAGNVVDADAMRKVAKEVVNECKGLPLALVILGNMLQYEDHKVWVDVAEQLRTSNSEDVSPIFTSIKFSYDNIKTRESKLCFLLCCIFPEDHKLRMDELLLYVMGENILRGVKSLEDTRGRLHKIVGELITKSLLLKGDDNDYIMMYNIVRDFAISIASEDGFIVKAGMRLKQWPKMEKMVKPWPNKEKEGHCLRLSLMRNDIREILHQPDWPQLLTLSLESNKWLESIPDNFLEHMKELLTLDLSNTRIASLPTSLSHLKLRTLRLEKCRLLKDLSLLGSLKTLEMLSLKGSGLQRFPKEIKGLTKLKLLDVSHCKFSEWGIEHGILSSLCCLEELNMKEGHNWWVPDGYKTTSLSEVASMTSLSRLYLDIGWDIKLWLEIEILFQWDKLSSFCIRANKVNTALSTRYTKSFDVSLEATLIAPWVKKLLECCDQLFLRKCEGIDTLLKLSPPGLNNVKCLLLESCEDLYCLLTAKELVSQKSFSELENLTLLKCNIQTLLLSSTVLRKFGDGTVTKAWAESRDLACYNLTTSPKNPLFTKLRMLCVSDCHKLLYLFPNSVFRGLLQLEELYVRKCEVLAGLVIGEELTDICMQVFSPRLRVLELEELKCLSYIFYPHNSEIVVDCPSLETLVIRDCPFLDNIPFDSQSAPKLKLFDADQDWFE